ncbi:MAG: hypothetical protein J6K16_01705 [Alphaproteobacteria bacterium]|nr:hypothetical protein [Alphaproteobacteria bacterium]
MYEIDRKLKLYKKRLKDFEVKEEVYQPEEDLPFWQAAMKKSEFATFSDFYNYSIKNKSNPEKKQFNAVSKQGINLRIPQDIVNHDYNNHDLNVEQWETLLKNIDNVKAGILSRHKPKFSGKPVLLKINVCNEYYGAVVEVFKKNNPIMTTAFIDKESSIDNWIKNEGVPSGTKTTFLDITLKDIIAKVEPDFKSKIMDNAVFYQKGKETRLTEDNLKEIKQSLIKPISAEVRSRAIASFGSSGGGRGYMSTGDSTNAEIARSKGLATASEISKAFKKLGFNISAKIIEQTQDVEEWHHTGKNFKETNFYNVEDFDIDAIYDELKFENYIKKQEQARREKVKALGFDKLSLEELAKMNGLPSEQSLLSMFKGKKKAARCTE